MAVEITSLTGYAASTFLANNSGATALECVAGTGTGNVVRATSPTLVTPALGTPSSGTLTSCTGLPISTGVSGLGSGVATLLATFSSANLAAALTDETGSGANVFGTSPTLATPVINVGSDATGDIYYRNSGGAFTRLAIGTTGQVLNVGGSGVPAWATSSGGGNAQTANPLSQFASTTSSQLAGVMSDETGSGALVFATSPTLVTPILGVASATTINKVALTAPATGSTLTIADGKTLTASNTLTFTGTDGSTITAGAGGTIVYLATAQTFSAKKTFGPTSTVAGLNVGAYAGDPSTPVNGDIHYNSTGNTLRAYINGTFVSLGAGGGGGSSYDESNPILDTSSNELLKFVKVASAVNEVTISNNATGSAPIISATGGDTNVGLALEGKGTGAISLWTPNNEQGVIFESGGYGSRFATTYRLEIGTAAGDINIKKYGNQSVNFKGAGFCEFKFTAPYARAAFGTIPTYDLYTPTQITSDQNNYEAGTNERAPIWRMSTDASRNITGLTFSYNGAMIRWINVGSADLVIKHESASSTAANRFLCSTGADITIAAGQRADLWYDATSARWRVWKTA